jgi:aminopeptidase N
VNDHLPWGYIDNTIYLPGGVPDYFDTVYRVGAMFHRDLRAIMGDEAYFTFLRDYVQTYKYEIATTQDFWNLLSSYTDADLSGLYTEYFQNPLQ